MIDMDTFKLTLYKDDLLVFIICLKWKLYKQIFCTPDEMFLRCDSMWDKALYCQ